MFDWGKAHLLLKIFEFILKVPSTRCGLNNRWRLGTIEFEGVFPEKSLLEKVKRRITLGIFR